MRIRVSRKYFYDCFEWRSNFGYCFGDLDWGYKRANYYFRFQFSFIKLNCQSFDLNPQDFKGFYLICG